ncbi:hypothetical protein WSM22_16860 [Cytophagales bacterium WSM2-2]|nr:hypothetical protein WSM22_16860 [Cytophagales bacterium WSM2-2]
MSQLVYACSAILSQLSGAIKQLSDSEFTRPSRILSGSSIGQHLRHTLEFFICMEHGCQHGIINYDKRAHDKMIESDKVIAIEIIERISHFVKNQVTDKALVLEVGYDLNSDESVVVQTNYFRELTYNIEHAVHHMAIMKIGIREIAPNINLPADFGVAASTLRYREETAAVAR